MQHEVGIANDAQARELIVKPAGLWSLSGWFGGFGHDPAGAAVGAPRAHALIRVASTSSIPRSSIVPPPTRPSRDADHRFAASSRSARRTSLSCVRIAGVREEELLSVDLVIGDRFLPRGRY